MNPLDQNDSGILKRLKRAQRAPEGEEEEELLVFGYACKLFHDDEKALQVENGELLVEIDGQKIDRFDGRGILPNLKSCESLRAEVKLEEYLSPEEVCVEEMCEDERYRLVVFRNSFLFTILSNFSSIRQLFSALGSYS